MSTDTSHMSRVLGRLDVIAVAFGAMIGFGWIVLTGDFLDSAGTFGAAGAFIIGGIVVAFVALTYAELVAALPRAGGAHIYVMRAMGSRASFFCSWALVLGYASVVAFEAVALPQTLLYIWPDMLAGKLWVVAGYDVYVTWVAVGVFAAILMTWLNVIGVRPAAIFQTIAVLFLAVVGVTLVAGSVIGGSVSSMQPLWNGGVGGFMVVLVATPFLYVGFDVVPQSAEEIRLPFRKIGEVLLLSVGLAISWYVMVMITTSSSMPASSLVDANLATADALKSMLGHEAWGTFLVLGGVAGILTSWNGFLIGASRLVFALSRSGMLPAWFGKLHPKYRTPANAVLFIGVFSLFSPLFGRQAMLWLVNAGGLAIVLAWIMVAVSFILLRWREPDMPRPFRTPGGVGTGMVAVVLSACMAALYLPLAPAALAPPEWTIIVLWGVASLFLVGRIPRVAGGPYAEEQLLGIVRQRAGADRPSRSERVS